MLYGTQMEIVNRPQLTIRDPSAAVTASEAPFYATPRTLRSRLELH